MQFKLVMFLIVMSFTNIVISSEGSSKYQANLATFNAIPSLDVSCVLRRSLVENVKKNQELFRNIASLKAEYAARRKMLKDKRDGLYADSSCVSSTVHTAAQQNDGVSSLTLSTLKK